jgi:GMP synthase (glutamine-hydrolysing)
MRDAPRYLLLQVRNPDDPMRAHEVHCLLRALCAEPEQLHVFDLLSSCPTPVELAPYDIVLLGGSGHYSAASHEPWIAPALEAMRELHALRKPTFASCWGFQAMARALGGTVINDRARAEVGTHRLFLTPAGLADPIFSPLGATFAAQMGHEDHVVELPPGATLLAVSERGVYQAYRLDDAPIYCTQFHPELRAGDLLLRLNAYPEYVELLAGVSYDEFARSLTETPETEQLLGRFVSWALRVESGERRVES